LGTLQSDKWMGQVLHEEAVRWRTATSAVCEGRSGGRRASLRSVHLPRSRSVGRWFAHQGNGPRQRLLQSRWSRPPSLPKSSILARHDVIFAAGAPSETLLVHSGNVERFDNFVEHARLFGEDAAEEARCPPIAFGSRGERLLSRLCSAASPWVDCRNEFDKARDRIEELAELVNS
jgi:hypothetical protein